MSLETLLGFFAMAWAGAWMPGPDIAFVLTESLARGRKTGVFIATGLVSGVTVHTLLCATGLSLVFLRSPAGFALIKYFGCAYFLYLAWSILRGPAVNPAEAGAKGFEGGTFLKCWRRGFLMCVVNPKVALFFIAFLPGFVKPEGFPVFAQMMILGLVFALTAFSVFVIIALAAGSFSRFFSNPQVYRALKYAQVLIFLALAAGILFLEHSAPAT